MLPFTSLRVIPFQYFTGLENMALDLLFAEQVGHDQKPILRFYGWNPFCLSLGRHQNLNNVDIEAIDKNKIDIVRRPTGGSAILHAQELTYSFIIPRGYITHHEIYEIFHILLAGALKDIGFDVALSTTKKDNNYLNKGDSTFACFNRAAKSEIQLKGKKVVGSAQKIYKKSILQHGSIIIGREHEKIINYIRTDSGNKEGQTELLKHNSTNLENINKKKISEVEISSALSESFFDKYKIPIHYKYPTKSEKKEAEKFNSQLFIPNQYQS
ncbi:MAG: lipoate--protein ligase family protein [Calditrichaeota bacterium]|nr:MAG: lipoate--protein ligase family protein [Calditrichota bacterium]MBL1204237.1 lipoate--protein ligase family protein [Calditrichota bacterium]NOG44067.1 lipoate--protein ligase family protein [Calditrichota bacterium]